MGLLDEAISFVTGTVAQVPVVGAPIAGVAQAVVAPVLSVVEQVPVAGQILAGDAQDGVAGGVLDFFGGGLFGGAGGANGAGRPPQGFNGGNGRFSTRTIVQTMDLTTGKIVNEKMMPGSPHIMNSDITAARRVIRQSAKLARRIPRKTVRESKTKQLTDAAIDKAMRDVNTTDVCCPPR